MTNEALDAAGTAVSEEMHEAEMLHGFAVLRDRNHVVLFPSKEELLGLVKSLHADGYLTCLDITGVDYLTFGRRTTAEGDVRISERELPFGVKPERFEVVYHLLRHGDTARVRLRVQVSAEDAAVPSLFDIHPGSEAPEREVFDMYGIVFEGHPDLTRILMPEDWIGHPLRKDYSSGRIPVQFKGAPSR